MPCSLDVNPHPHFGHRNSIGALHFNAELGALRITKLALRALHCAAPQRDPPEAVLGSRKPT